MLMLPRDSARCNRLNNLKQAAKWSSHFESRDMQRVGGLVAHYAFGLPSRLLWQSTFEFYSHT